MATAADTKTRPDLVGAADRLLKACTGAACIRVVTEPIDALARGVIGVAKVYDSAAADARPQRRNRK
ncbi:hypothetical protein [Sphingosinicella sp. CPCC 101087]|uniref:hypothetical protein n=1 Tax=Sphingosinicella sp. CPCC 101087 TaxID=2497754 RepID=UPI00101D4076|nr:hypothetical protein [Sphingosinicella sp. CPCC 101087]